MGRLRKKPWAEDYLKESPYFISDAFSFKNNWSKKKKIHDLVSIKRLVPIGRLLSTWISHDPLNLNEIRRDSPN